MPPLRVHFLPEFAAPDSLAGSLCVVIDVLRATTTIVAALDAEAVAVLPCLTIEEARHRSGAFRAGKALLGGERGGRPIEGFDLGNSPAEYSQKLVAGKTVVLTTTNGTKALLHCAAADEILVGAIVNLTAVCQRLQADSAARPIELVCAGTDGQITREDVLFAGAIVVGLQDTEQWQLNDQAEIARDAWLSVTGLASGSELEMRLITALCASRGGRNLIEIGMAGDIELAAMVDRYAVVPRYLPSECIIQASG